MPFFTRCLLTVALLAPIFFTLQTKGNANNQSYIVWNNHGVEKLIIGTGAESSLLNPDYGTYKTSMPHNDAELVTKVTPVGIISYIEFKDKDENRQEESIVTKTKRKEASQEEAANQFLSQTDITFKPHPEKTVETSVTDFAASRRIIILRNGSIWEVQSQITEKDQHSLLKTKALVKPRKHEGRFPFVLTIPDSEKDEIHYRLRFLGIRKF